MDLPVLDLSRWNDSDALALARELRSAAASPGFFYVKEHGVPPALVEKTRVAARRFFALPLEEMLSRWTNDLFRATPHRVVNRTGRERYTIPFFFGTNYDVRIECLPTCSGADRPPRYEPIQAGEYLARRLNEVYGSLPEAAKAKT
jgi:isopenicillin N synthase-like dioxygenase